MNVLSDELLKYETDWLSIIRYFRDRYIRLDPEDVWQPVPEEEFSDVLSNNSPRPIDLRTLPSGFRKDPFDIGIFRDPILVDSQAWGRRVVIRSDPIQDGKPERDNDSSESLDGESLVNIPCLSDTSMGSTVKQARLK